MKKKIIFLNILFIFILVMPKCYAVNTYKNSDTDYNVLIEDDADLLSEVEEEKLYNELIDLTEYGNIIFKSIDKNPYSSTSYFAQTFYHNNFGSDSGTLFLIDMDNREIYIFSDGDNYKVITKYKTEVITDNVYKYASNKDYYTCASEAYIQILKTLQGEKIAEPMRHICNALFAVMSSVLFSFVLFKIVSKNKVADSKELFKDCKKEFSFSEPIAKKIGEHKVYSPSSSGSRRRSF